MIQLLRACGTKVLAFGLLGIMAYGIVALVIAPIWVQHGDLEDNIEIQRALLGRLEVAAQRAEAAHGTIGQPDAGKSEIFLGGESDAIRIAGLQFKLSEAAQSIGARLSSTQAVTPRDSGGVRLIGVQTQFSTTLEQLQKFVFDLETARPMLFVSSLHVSRGPDRDGQEISDLDVRLVVMGPAQSEVLQP